MTPTQIIQHIKKHDPEYLMEIEKLYPSLPSEEQLQRIWQTLEWEPERTRVFITLCVIRFSPATLDHGARLPRGLASRMASIKQVTNGAISQMVDDLMFQYKNYTSFQKKVNNYNSKII